MKKIFFRLAACMFLWTVAPMLTCCNVEGMSSLKDVSHPYAAEYKCKKLQIGGEDALENFEYIKLDLKHGGTFECFYLDKNGNEGAYEGKYKIDAAEGSATFSAPENSEEKTYVFPYRGGKICVEYLFGDRLLYGEFSAVE